MASIRARPHRPVLAIQALPEPDTATGPGPAEKWTGPRPAKRVPQNYLQNTFSKPAPPGGVLKKKPLTKQRKGEIRAMRDRGACLRCRLLKKPCSGDDPCTRCLAIITHNHSSRCLGWMDCIRPAWPLESIFGFRFLHPMIRDQLVDVVDQVTARFRRTTAAENNQLALHLADQVGALIVSNDRPWSSVSVLVLLSVQLGNALGNTSLGTHGFLFAFLGCQSARRAMRGKNRADVEVSHSLWSLSGYMVAKALEKLLRPAELVKQSPQSLTSLFIIVFVNLMTLCTAPAAVEISPDGTHCAYDQTEIYDELFFVGRSVEKRALVDVLTNYLVYIGDRLGLFLPSHQRPKQMRVAPLSSGSRSLAHFENSLAFGPRALFTSPLSCVSKVHSPDKVAEARREMEADTEKPSKMPDKPQFKDEPAHSPAVSDPPSHEQGNAKTPISSGQKPGWNTNEITQNIAQAEILHHHNHHNHHHHHHHQQQQQQQHTQIQNNAFDQSAPLDQSRLVEEYLPVDGDNNAHQDSPWYPPPYTMNEPYLSSFSTQDATVSYPANQADAIFANSLDPTVWREIDMLGFGLAPPGQSTILSTQDPAYGFITEIPSYSNSTMDATTTQGPSMGFVESVPYGESGLPGYVYSAEYGANKNDRNRGSY